MRILHVIPALSYRFGGPTQAVLEICKGLVKYGQDVTIFTTNSDVKKRLDVTLNREINLEGIKIFYFSVPFFNHYKFSFSLLRTIKETIRNFDIIHIHSLFQFPSFIASYYARKFNKPYIIRPLGQLDSLLLKRHRIRKILYLNLFERKNLESATYIHFTSEKEKNLALKTKIKFSSFVLPLGIDLEKFKAMPPYGTFRHQYPQIKNKKIILFLGRISFKKGLDILIEAFSQLCKVRNDVHLVIAGPDDEGYGNVIIRLIKKRDILDRVTFTGMLLEKDKLSVLRDSDVFVLPSYSENFGLAVIEAMASGLPIIISDRVNIYPDILENEAGIVTQPQDYSLYKAIGKILNSQEFISYYSKNAKKLVQDKFNIEVITPQLISIYKEILNKWQR